MSDGDMHAFLMHSLGIENCEYTAQQLFNAAKETLLWADGRIELKLSAPSAMDLRTALLEAIKAATMGNSGGRSAAAPSGCVPEGPAAEFVNGVPTTDDDDARYHPASGKIKVAPAGGMFDLKSLKQKSHSALLARCPRSVAANSLRVRMLHRCLQSPGRLKLALVGARARAVPSSWHAQVTLTSPPTNDHQQIRQAFDDRYLALR